MGTAKRQRKKQYRQARVEAALAAQKRKRRIRLGINFGLFVLALVAVLVWLSQRGDDEGDVEASDSSTTVATADVPCPELDGSSEQMLEFSGPPPMCIDPANEYHAVFATSEGTARFVLDTQTTPQTTNNFVFLALYKYYDGTQLFRTNTGIGIIQGGSPHTNDNTDPGPGYTIPDEPADQFDFSNPAGGTGPFTYTAGDLVMARSQGPNSSGAQFFFGASDAVSGLDAQGTYINFGQVSSGLEVLQAILALHQDTDPSNPGEGAPSRPVTVNQVIIEVQPPGQASG